MNTNKLEALTMQEQELEALETITTDELYIKLYGESENENESKELEAVEHD